MAIIKYFFNEKLNFRMIADTYKNAFKKDLNLDYWKWRFEDNPNDDKIYIDYILEDKVLAAYYAVSPYKIKVENKGNFKIALSNMTFTHPDFQGRGYFKKLATELFKILKQDGFVGAYGFANSNSHYGFRKYLNWVDLAGLNLFQTNRNRFRSFLLKNIESYEFTDSIADYNTVNMIQGMSYNTNKISLARDVKNLRWRLIDNPSQTYRSIKIKKGCSDITGLIFYKFFRGEIDIMEFFYNQKYENEKYNILGAGLNYLLNKHKDVLNIWSNLFSEEHLQLEKLGFIESQFNSYFGIIPFTEDIELLDSKKWHYRFLDSDIF